MKRTCLALAGLALVTACSSGSDGPKQPSESAFTQGTCRTAAKDVLAIGRETRSLGDSRSPAVDAMTDPQSRLDAIATGAEPAYAPALRQLVTAVGLVRLRAHTGSYQASLGRDVLSAYDGVLSVCVKASS